MQDDIARSVVAEFQASLGGRPGATLVDPTTNVVEAYLLYLHGRFSWNQRTEQGLRDAIRLYQQALAHDDTYARAWAGLADAYIILGNFSWELPDSAYPRAREAVTHSLALAPQLEEAHVAAARIAMWYDHDWPAAELAFVKALQLDRNVAFGHYWFSAFLDATGQHERAEAGLALAERLDPLAPQIAAGVAHHYFWTRDFQRAIAVIEAVLNEHPTFANGYSYLGRSTANSARMRTRCVSLRARTPSLAGGTLGCLLR